MTIVVNLDAKVNKKYSIKIPKKQSEKDSGIQKAFSSFIEKTEKLISKEPKEKSDELGMFGIRSIRCKKHCPSIKLPDITLIWLSTYLMTHADSMSLTVPMR